MAFKLIISAFEEGDVIPELYTSEGADISPSLEWSGHPRETGSFAIIMDDPDAPSGTFNHWLLWDIPPSVHALAQGFKAGQLGQSGTNDFGNRGYGGPRPPRGRGPHRYFFRLYALDVANLDVHHGAKRSDLERVLPGHVLAETQYMGRFERK